MAETLITLLVSEQTVPNVLFLKWFFTNHKQTVDILFVSTEKMEEKRKSLNIIEALECSNPHIANWKVIKVDENSIDDIVKKIDTKLSEWKHDSFIVSITGGTKIMSLATYAYFDEKENCQIFYQPLNQNLQKIFPEHEEYSLPDYLITIEEYMMAHGIEFKSNNTCIRDYLYNKKIYENLIQDNHNIIALMNKLQNFKKFKKKMEKGKPIDLTSLSDDFFFKSEKEPIDKYDQYEIFKLISKFDFDATAINEKEYRYITGGWFEEFVYQKIKEEQKIPDENIALNVHIEKGNDNNELDVIYIQDNRLHVIECKSFIDEKDDKDLLNLTLYKSQAIIKSKFGLNALSSLYTQSRIDKESALSRAKEFGIEIVDGTKL